MIGFRNVATNKLIGAVSVALALAPELVLRTVAPAGVPFAIGALIVSALGFAFKERLGERTGIVYSAAAMAIFAGFTAFFDAGYLAPVDLSLVGLIAMMLSAAFFIGCVWTARSPDNNAEEQG